MAELDTNIPLGIKVPEYDPMGDAYKFAQMRNAQQTFQSNNLALEENRRKLQEQTGLRNMLASGVDPLSTEGQRQAFMIAPTLGPTFVKTALEAQKAQRDAEAARTDLAVKNLGYARSLMPGISDQGQLDKFLGYVNQNLPNVAVNIPTKFDEFAAKRDDLMKTADQSLQRHFYETEQAGPNGPIKTMQSTNMYGAPQGTATVGAVQSPVKGDQLKNEINGAVSLLNPYTGVVTPTTVGGQANPAAAAGAPAGAAPGPQSYNSSVPAVTPQQRQQTAAPGANLYNQDRAREAIAGPESGGRYDAVGPVTKNGDRAYGKYQIMGNNISQWTKEALGVSMSPQEFMKNKEAQDAVFDYKFGQAVAKYGNVQDAASVWFSGRPMSQAGNASDVLGTTVPQYVRNFMAGYQTGPATPRMAVAQPFVSNADIPMGPGQPSMPTTGFQPQPTNALAPQQQAAAQNALIAQQNQPTTTPLQFNPMPVSRAPAQPVAPVAPTTAAGQPYSTGGLAEKGLAEEQVNRENAFPVAKATINNIAGDVSDTLTAMETLKNHAGLSKITGLASGDNSWNVSDDSRDAMALLKQIKASGALDKLKELRSESTSGNTKLNITNKDVGLVESAIAALDTSQTTKSMQTNLDKAMSALKRIGGNLTQQYEDTYAYRGEKAPAIASSYVNPKSGSNAKALSGTVNFEDLK